MKNFSISLFALICAMFFISSCEKESQGINVDNYLQSQRPVLPADVHYFAPDPSQSPVLPENVKDYHGNPFEFEIVASPKPGLNEVFITDMASGGGILTMDRDNPGLWSMTIPKKLQQVDPRGGGRDGVCLYANDYGIIQNPDCSSANVFNINMIYNQGTYATGKFIYLTYPWIKWGQDAQLVQPGLQEFADSVYYGLLDIGVPLGFSVCVYAGAYDDPNSGNHVYAIELYVNGVPAGVDISFKNIYTVNCHGTGYANAVAAELEINPYCSRTPPECLGMGGN